MSLPGWLQVLIDPTADLVASARGHGEEVPTPLDRLAHARTVLNQRAGQFRHGAARSPFRGQGLMFRDLREYRPGDDVRRMDWAVLARTGQPHIREYEAERAVTVWLLVDATPAMQFGKTRAKLAGAIEVAAALMVLAAQAEDRIGLIAWTGSAEPLILPPRTGETYRRRLVASLETLIEPETAMPVKPITRMPPRLDTLVSPDSLVIALSDFAFLDDADIAAESLADWTRVARRGRWAGFLIQDPLEAHLPFGLHALPLAAESTGEPIWIETNSRWRLRALRRRMYQQVVDRMDKLAPLMPVQLVRTDHDALDAVWAWLRRVSR